MHAMRIDKILFFTLTAMEGHNFAFLENTLCYTPIKRKWHEHPVL